MTPLFKKLSLGAHRQLQVLDAPATFETELLALAQALPGVQVERTVSGPVGFALAFVQTLAQVQRAADALLPAATPDATLWMVYPKGSSKRYRCEFNRDNGWAALGQGGYEPVSMVAVDEDWSALRFRAVDHIQSMKRNPDGAISAAGRKKASAQRKA